LALEARRSENPSLLEIMGKLRVEAQQLARGLDKNLDDLKADLINHQIETKMTLRQVEEKISWWRFVQKMTFRRRVKRITRLAGTIRDLYADVEAAFLCADKAESVAAGVRSAYELRGYLNQRINDDTPIGEMIDALHNALGDAIKILEQA